MEDTEGIIHMERMDETDNVIETEEVGETDSSQGAGGRDSMIDTEEME